jgi:hypothetical protein
MDVVWGSGPSDIYIAGGASGWFSKMYHYDGTSWQPLKLDSRDGGPIQPLAAFGGIFGFSGHDVYAVGVKYPGGIENSLVIHFDGTTWSERDVIGGKYLQAVWGNSPTDLWVGGTHGSLFHFDGSTWRKFPLADSIWISRIAGCASNEVYASAYHSNQDGVMTFYVFKWDGVTWSVLRSFTQSSFVEDEFGYRIAFLGNQLFSVGSGVFKSTSGGWMRIFGNRSTGFTDMSGPQPDDFFAVGVYGLVYHYNGRDWFQFSRFMSNDVHFYGCWYDASEVFIVGTDGGGFKTFVLHGR